MRTLLDDTDEPETQWNEFWWVNELIIVFLNYIQAIDLLHLLDQHLLEAQVVLSHQEVPLVLFHLQIMEGQSDPDGNKSFW